MNFKKLDKKKGSGAPEIKGKYAYLVAIGDIATFPTIDEKGVRLMGDITFKPDCGMIPVYLSNTSQEFSYDVMGDDDEKTYKVKFIGTHPGTELEAMEFAKNQIEQPFLVLIPSCNIEEPWKLLGEITNPLIFTSTHKANRENSKFTFTFEQRIGSEFIYFSYGGVVIAPEVPGPNVPINGYWAKVDASNIDAHIAAWRTKLGISLPDSFQIGTITTTSNSVTIGLNPSGENYAIINGVKYAKSVAGAPKPYTAVSPNKLKRLFVYAIADANPFRLAEGVEGDQAVDPDLPEGALLIASIMVSDSGEIITPIEETGFKPKSDDTSYPVLLNSNTGEWVYAYTNSFTIKSTGLVSTPILKGFFINHDYLIWGGKILYVKNETGVDLTLKKTALLSFPTQTYFSFVGDYVVKNGETAILKWNSDNELELVKVSGSGGGKASEVENDSSITGASVKDALETLKATDGNLQSQIDAEITARQNADIAEANARTFADGILDGKITTEKNRNNSQDTAITAEQNTRSSVADKFLHYWNSATSKWISSGLKFVSGAVNQLEFTGKFKSDGILLNASSSTILPQEIKFKDGKFKAAKADGLERTFMLEGDNISDFSTTIDNMFTNNLGYIKPNWNATTYFSYNPDGANFFTAGASIVLNPAGIQYASSGSTLGRCHGNYIGFDTATQSFDIYREFSIDTAIPTQRVLVGYSDNWRAPGQNPINVAMSTIPYILGICMESGNPNILLIHHASSGPATIVDSGFVHNIKYVYGFRLTKKYGESFITVKLTRYDKNVGTLDAWNYVILADYVLNGHSAALWCVDELNTTAVKVSDFGIVRTKKRLYS